MQIAPQAQTEKTEDRAPEKAKSAQESPPRGSEPKQSTPKLADEKSDPKPEKADPSAPKIKPSVEVQGKPVPAKKIIQPKEKQQESG